LRLYEYNHLWVGLSQSYALERVAGKFPVNLVLLDVGYDD